MADPGLRYLQLCSRVLALSARKLADEPLLPHDFVKISEMLGRGVDSLGSDPRYEAVVSASTRQHNVTLDYLEDAVDYFGDAAANWTARAALVDRSNPLAVRAFNDQVMAVERAFLMPDPVASTSSSSSSSSSSVRNAAFGPVRGRDLDSVEVFPGVLEILDEMELGMATEVQMRRWEALRRHLSDLMIAVRQAAELLWDFHVF